MARSLLSILAQAKGGGGSGDGGGTVRKQSLSPEAASVQTFVISKADKDKALVKARQLGIRLELRPVTAEDLLHTYPPYEQTVYATMRDHAGYDRARAEALRARAEQYLWGIATAPQPPERVIGIAKREGPELTVFYTIPGEPDPWTARRMEQMDFQRCDVCGIRHHRTTVYLVRRPDGSVFYAGGTCADNLDLAKRVSNIMRVFKRFASWLSSHDEDLDLFGLRADERSGRGGGGFVDPLTALVIADALIAKEGYRSSKAYGREESTGYEVLQVLTSPKLMAYKNRLLQEWGRKGADLQKEGFAWVEEQIRRKGESGFLQNVKTALMSGSTKLIGFLAYVPQALRLWAEQRAKAQAAAKARAGTWPYRPEAVRYIAVKSSGTIRHHSGGEYDRYPRVVAQISLDPLPATVDQPVLDLRGDDDGSLDGEPVTLQLAAFLADHLLPRNVAVGLTVKLRREVIGSGEPVERGVLLKDLRRTLMKAFSLAQDKLTVEPVVAGAALVALVQRYPIAQELLGITDRHLASAAKKPDQSIPKGLAKKIASWPAGTWTVVRKHIQEIEVGYGYGIKDIAFVKLQREDGALLDWKASDASQLALSGDTRGRSGVLEAGDKIVFERATLGIAEPPDPRFGPQGRKISRVRWRLAR